MKTRESNFELLRIISILLIIIFHCSYHSGFAFMGKLNPNMFTIKVFWMFGELGVNLFMLIGGYFMVKASFRWKKVLLLFAQLYFYHFATIAFAMHKKIFFLGKGKELLPVLFPFMGDQYWFFTAYIIVYLLSPYVNRMLCSLNKQESCNLLLVLVTVFSIIPTVYGSMFNNTEGFLYYNRMIWLMVVYILGAHIRLHSFGCISGVKKSLLGSAATFLFIVVSILAIDRFSEFFSYIGIKEEAFFWQPNTVPMVLMSVFVFGIFMNIKIPPNRVINAVASTTLGIYLMHDGILRNWLWHNAFRAAQMQYTSGVIWYILKAALIVFIVGVIADFLRQIIERFTFLKLIETCGNMRNKSIQ